MKTKKEQAKAYGTKLVLYMIGIYLLFSFTSSKLEVMIYGRDITFSVSELITFSIAAYVVGLIIFKFMDSFGDK